MASGPQPLSHPWSRSFLAAAVHPESAPQRGSGFRPLDGLLRPR
jgi:hypothetical protein